MSAEIIEAKKIILSNLKANLHHISSKSGDEHTILAAGAKQFNSIWTRDFCFATGGLLAAKENVAVRDTLEFIIKNQRGDGLFPRVLDSYSSLTHFIRVVGVSLPLTEPLAPNFYSDHFRISIDSNSLVSWAFWRYLEATGEREWAVKFLPALEKAMEWCAEMEKDGLIVQPPFSDWKDSIAARRGKVFFTQLLYWQAMRSLSSTYAMLGVSASAAAWAERAENLRLRIESVFWDEAGGFYRDSQHMPIFSSDGNLAAIAWRFVDEAKSMRIISAMDRFGLWTSWGPRASQRYPWSQKGWLARVAFMHNYHDDYVWLWNSALALAAFKRLQLHQRGSDLVRILSERIIEDGEVGEIYQPEDGRQAKTWLYQSEAPFSWSSGMLLEVFEGLVV